MMNFGKVLMVVFGGAAHVPCTGQQAVAKKDSAYCRPAILRPQPLKFFSVRFEHVPAYYISSTAKQGSFGNSREKEKNNRVDVRLRFPLVNKPGITISGGFKYSEEEFHFENAATNTYQLYKNLEDRDLKSIGANINFIKPTRSNKYFIFRVSVDLNGDYGKKNPADRTFLKFAVAPLIGWKKNDNLSYAVGFEYGYSFGAPLFYPVFSWNKNLNKKWAVEALLPKSIRFRYSASKKNYWYAGAELAGASYGLNNNDAGFAAYDNLHLHRADLRVSLLLEKEIHNWLWFNISGGLSHNLNFNLTNSPRARKEIIIKNNLRDAAFFNIGIFLVPPRGFIKTIQ
jgi:Domain of unknown function (DUF6268)